jgi:thiol:disulfide interchange protein DsbD
MAGLQHLPWNHDMNHLFARMQRLLAILLLAVVAPAQAIDEKDLLPVADAFRLQAEAVTPGWIEFRWKIAPGYYLYKERIQVTLAEGIAFKANPLHLPPGQIKEDQFFGRMETYRDAVVAKLTGAAADSVTMLRFKVTYQGCADLGVCYPPQRQEVIVSLPDPARAAVAEPPLEPVIDLGQPAETPLTGLPGTLATESEARASNVVASTPSLLNLPGTTAPATEAVDALPLPEEEAFKVETIASSGTELLARFSMPKDYYLYRDKSGLRARRPVASATWARRSWPASRSFDDPEFGRVEVYLRSRRGPDRRWRARTVRRATIQLRVSLQGCQLDGICYPPMTRTVVRVDLPAASCRQS